MLKPYYQDDFATLYHGDCRDVISELGSQAVDAVVTDPPYGTNVAKWDKVAPYDILPDLLNVSKGAVLWFGSSPRIAVDLSEFSVQPERVLIWYVTFSLARTAARGIYYRWHPIYTWHLPPKHNGPNRDVLPIPQDGHNGWFHPGTKPLKLMNKLVGFCPDDGVLFDPYAGSGTTLVAAKNRGLRSIGVEINEDYCKIIVSRLAQDVMRLDAAHEPYKAAEIWEPASASTAESC